MKHVVLLVFTTLLFLPACPRRVKPDEKPSLTGLRVSLVEEGQWMMVTRPIETGRSVAAGLATALEEVATLALPPAGHPMVVYEGDGRRSVAFPVAGRVEIPRPWAGLSVNAGTFAETTLESGLLGAAAHNDDFLLEVQAMGHRMVGPVFHRILDDPRTTAPEQLRVQILVAIAD